MTLGMGLIALDPKRLSSRIALIFFAAFSVLAFTVGVRLAVVVSLTVFLAVLATQRRMPRDGVFWLSVGAGLALMGAIKVTRGTSSDGFWSGFSALAGLREMGSSLRATTELVSWHALGAEPLGYGLTYLTPFIRGLRTVAGIPNPSPSADPGMLQYRVETRGGSIGGSMVGEAYYNFGFIGTFFLFLVWGALIARLSRPNSVQGSAFLALAMSLFLFQIRGFFSPIPWFTVAGGGLLALATLNLSASMANHESPGRSGASILESSEVRSG